MDEVGERELGSAAAGRSAPDGGGGGGGGVARRDGRSAHGAVAATVAGGEALGDSVAHAAALFNAHSPQFVASLVSDAPAEHAAFYAATNAPFVGDGFTRWVDGQYALKRPELGLANWERGRLFGRGGVLSGDSVFTVRARMTQTDPSVHR